MIHLKRIKIHLTHTIQSDQHYDNSLDKNIENFHKDKQVDETDRSDRSDRKEKIFQMLY